MIKGNYCENCKVLAICKYCNKMQKLVNEIDDMAARKEYDTTFVAMVDINISCKHFIGDYIR